MIVNDMLGSNIIFNIAMIYVAFYNYEIVEDRRIIIQKFSLLVSNILPAEKSNVLNIFKIADISSITNVFLNNNYLLNVFM